MIRSGSCDNKVLICSLFRVVMAACAIVIVACAPVGRRRSSSVSPQASGQIVAEDIRRRFLDTPYDCGVERPAFLCSGVLYRGTGASPDRHAWNPKENSQASGGVSFSFLRVDSGSPSAAGTDGFIFAAYDEELSTILKPEILCSFAIDGMTNSRGEQGCGGVEPLPDIGAPCESVGVHTAAQWWVHFDTVAKRSILAQCGFDVRSGREARARDFIESMKAKVLLNEHGGAMVRSYNELRVATWPQDVPRELPLQAFIYLAAHEVTGLANAQYNQKDLADTAERVIPILRMTLNTNDPARSSFEFRQEDQAVPLP